MLVGPRDALVAGLACLHPDVAVDDGGVRVTTPGAGSRVQLKPWGLGVVQSLPILSGRHRKFVGDRRTTGREPGQLHPATAQPVRRDAPMFVKPRPEDR